MRYCSNCTRKIKPEKGPWASFRTEIGRTVVCSAVCFQEALAAWVRVGGKLEVKIERECSTQHLLVNVSKAEE